MSILKQFRETLIQRLQGVLWRSVATDVETEAALQDMECLDRLEQAAQRYEAAGKQHLADALRRRASLVASSDPGSSIVAALENMSQEPTQDLTPKLSVQNASTTSVERSTTRRSKD